MKHLIAFSFVTLLSTQSFAQTDIRSLMLGQLRATHDQAAWFVPLNTAIDGLTAQQANWKPEKGDHSSGELVHHLLFWNQRQLQKFKGEPAGDNPKTNDETFEKFDQAQWEATYGQLKQVMTDLESWVKSAPESDLKSHAENLANISMHNAYHIGQIVVIRKLQGSWHPEKGVK